MSFGAKSREKVQHEVKWVVLYNNGHAKLPNHIANTVLKFNTSFNLREFGLNFKQTSLFKTNTKTK